MKLSWGEVETAVKQLAQLIQQDGYAFDGLIAVARGGWIPTRLLASHFDNVPLLSLSPSMPFTLSHAFENGLLLDDCAESGRTLEDARHLVQPMGGRLQTAVLFTRSDSLFVPDYYVAIVDEPVQFPWRSG